MDSKKGTSWQQADDLDAEAAMGEQGETGPEGYRDYWEEWMERKKTRSRFRRSLLISVGTNGVAGALTMAVVYHISMSIIYGGVDPLGTALLIIVLLPAAFILGAVSGLIAYWASPPRVRSAGGIFILPGVAVALIVVAILLLGAPW